MSVLTRAKGAILLFTFPQSRFLPSRRLPARLSARVNQNPKAESPKAERSPKSENGTVSIRYVLPQNGYIFINPKNTQIPRFGFRTSAFFRVSALGFRP